MTTEQQLEEQETEIRALQLLEQANRSNNPLAQHNLAVMLQTAAWPVVPRDERRAIELFERAGRHGVPAAKAFLAHIYEQSAG
jgi:TPR repeat protein